MTSINVLTCILAAAPAVPAKSQSADQSSEVDISDEFAKSNPAATGFDIAEGKVKVVGKKVVTTARIEHKWSQDIDGENFGFSVSFKPIKSKGNRYLSLKVKGDIVLKGDFDGYAEIMTSDEEGRNVLGFVFCKNIKYYDMKFSCAARPDWHRNPISAIKPSDLKKGVTVMVPLTAETAAISKITMQFRYDVAVGAGFTLSDFKLVK